MLGLEFYSVRTHWLLQCALSWFSCDTLVLAIPAWFDCMPTCVHRFNLEISVDIFWRDVFSGCGSQLLLRLTCQELEQWWMLVGLVWRCYFWIVCMSMLPCMKQILWRTISKQMFKRTSVNSTDKNKCSVAISSARKGRVGRELF